MGTYLSRTPSSTGSRTIATVSFWVKRGNLKASGDHFMLEASSSTSPFNMTRVRFADDLLVIDNTLNGSAANGFMFQSNREYRDPSAWYHIFFSIDVTQANATDGWLLYVNGVQQTKALSYWVQNANLEFSQSSVQMNIGRRHDNTTDNFDGYLAEYHYIDGTRKLYTDFGQTDSTTGIWKPKTYSGSYGTNGFKLEFKNAAALGTDTSGNNNTFTVTNAGTGAQVVDTPSNNFCTLSPLSEGADATLTKGNLEISYANNTRTCSNANMGVNSGKWYWEFKVTAISASPNPVMLGIGELPYGPDLGTYLGQNASGWGYAGEDGTVYNSGSNSAYGATYTTGDIIGVAFDADNGNLYFYKNGTIQNSGTAAATGLTSSSTGFYYPAVGKSSGVRTFTAQANFGNPPFTIASGNADGAGYGNFEYAVPSGYYALCTKNLNTYG